MWKSRQWLSWILPGIVFIIGLGVSLALQTHTRDGVFFSGDAGLKALLAQQFSAGQWRVALDIPQPTWVLQLWRHGLYPFTPPYAYEQQGNYFITFPFTFPAITAPFHALLGYRGLYVVPLVSLWVIWWRFWEICRIWQIRSSITALSLGLVILASPLTLYGAMYWEHTLAVALAFWGLSGLLFHATPEDSSDHISLNEALVDGVCLGLAVWFRPEFLCLVAILTALMVASHFFPKKLPKFLQLTQFNRLTLGVVLAFVGSMVGTVIGFFGMNLVIYGHALGIHSIQIVEESSPGQQITQAWDNYRQLTLSLLRYFPAVVLGLGLPWVMRGRARTASLVLLIIALLFAIAVPLIVPPGAGGKQWGPRFYLILIPMVGLIIAAGLQQVSQVKRPRSVTLVAIGLVLVLGFHSNIVNGGILNYRDLQTNSTSLLSNFEPIAPALETLASYDQPWVAVSHQYVAQVLWPSVRLKTFFRAETEDALTELATALLQQEESSFLYICYPHSPCPLPEQGPLRFKHSEANVIVSFKRLGTFGKYPFYLTSIKTEP